MAGYSGTPLPKKLGIKENFRVALIDMPGYGFAKAPKALVAKWTRLIRAYLAGRAPLTNG